MTPQTPAPLRQRRRVDTTRSPLLCRVLRNIVAAPVYHGDASVTTVTALGFGSVVPRAGGTTRQQKKSVQHNPVSSEQLSPVANDPPRDWGGLLGDTRAQTAAPNPEDEHELIPTAIGETSPRTPHHDIINKTRTDFNSTTQHIYQNGLQCISRSASLSPQVNRSNIKTNALFAALHRPVLLGEGSVELSDSFLQRLEAHRMGVKQSGKQKRKRAGGGNEVQSTPLSPQIPVHRASVVAPSSPLEKGGFCLSPSRFERDESVSFGGASEESGGRDASSRRSESECSDSPRIVRSPVSAAAPSPPSPPVARDVRLQMRRSVLFSNERPNFYPRELDTFQGPFFKMSAAKKRKMFIKRGVEVRRRKEAYDRVLIERKAAGLQANIEKVKRAAYRAVLWFIFVEAGVFASSAAFVKRLLQEHHLEEEMAAEERASAFPESNDGDTQDVVRSLSTSHLSAPPTPLVPVASPRFLTSTHPEYTRTCLHRMVEQRVADHIRMKNDAAKRRCSAFLRTVTHKGGYSPTVPALRRASGLVRPVLSPQLPVSPVSPAFVQSDKMKPNLLSSVTQAVVVLSRPLRARRFATSLITTAFKSLKEFVTFKLALHSFLTKVRRAQRFVMKCRRREKIDITMHHLHFMHIENRIIAQERRSMKQTGRSQNNAALSAAPERDNIREADVRIPLWLRHSLIHRAVKARQIEKKRELREFEDELLAWEKGLLVGEYLADCDADIAAAFYDKHGPSPAKPMRMIGLARKTADTMIHDARIFLKDEDKCAEAKKRCLSSEASGTLPNTLPPCYNVFAPKFPWETVPKVQMQAPKHPRGKRDKKNTKRRNQ